MPRCHCVSRLCEFFMKIQITRRLKTVHRNCAEIHLGQQDGGADVLFYSRDTWASEQESLKTIKNVIPDEQHRGPELWQGQV